MAVRASSIGSGLGGNGQFGNVLKVVVIGDVDVGKTSLILRYTNDEFRPSLMNTVGVDLKVKDIIVDGKTYTVRLWDTAGQERYKSIRGTFFRGASGAIVVYDITKQQTFASIPRWLDDLENSSSETSPVVMFVGNKVDRANERKVSRLKAEETAISYKVKYSEVSAKTGDGVEKAFETFIMDMIKTKESQQQGPTPRKDSPTIQVHDRPESNRDNTTCKGCSR